MSLFLISVIIITRLISQAPPESNHELNDIVSVKELSKPGSELPHHLKEQAVRKRLVSKKGHCNITLLNVPRKQKVFAQDIFTTAVDMPWR